MIVSSQPPSPQLPRTLGKTSPEASETNPWQMDRFELQQEVWDADRKVDQLRHQAATGHTRALTGLSVLVTSLVTMAAQSILTGGNGLSPALLAPLIVGTGTGAALLAHGVYKRDSAGDEISLARIEARHLQSVYDQRFEKPE